MVVYKNGLVSVIMPTYKRSDKLIRAIKSVLNQTYDNIELILVNDNDPSDEYTKILLNKVSIFNSDCRFKLIMQSKHINGAVARNVGIACAEGEFIAFLDDDDWWKEEKIEKQVKAIKKLDETYGVISCKIERYNNNILIQRLPNYKNGNVYKDILELKSDFATGTLLFRHTYLDATGYFDENLLRHQDLQLLIKFTYKYKLFQIPEYLHCCDVSDAQNRPNVKKIIEAKKRLFISVKDIYDTCGIVTKWHIFILNKFEVARVYLRTGDIIHFILNSSLLLLSPYCFFVILSKALNKINWRKNS